jgi:glycosyltransferase involved in cell wall biosynthesis
MRVLHLHSTFDAGGKELRCVRLINAFGKEVVNTIVSAVPHALGAASLIDRSIPVYYRSDFPSLRGKPTPWRLLRLAQAMTGHDLVLTYNWGAMDAVMAHTIYARPLGLPPLVHHEDGFNSDEANGLKPTRNLYRRLALHGASAVVVPSTLLERIARDTWQVPGEKLHRIPNGIATGAYRGKPRPDVLPTLVKRKGELWVGTLAGLREVKNLPALVRAFAALPEEWQLVIVGEGPERERIREQAIGLGLAHRVHLPGFAADPSRVIPLFDLFALSSRSEQFPISVVEAMAGGLAVAAPAVGDVMQIVAPENRPFITATGDETALARALETLAKDAALRKRVGSANRERADAEYGEAKMIASYRALYAAAIGKPLFP